MRLNPITKKSFSLNSLVVTLAVIAFPITFLTIRHGVHVPLYLLLTLSVFHWIFISKNKFEIFNDKLSLLILLSFSSLLLATLITQAIRQDINLRSFDGPSRIFLAGLVFIYLKHHPINFLKTLERVIPLSLFILLGVLILNPETSAHWGGRLASKFVDPNSLGSQTMILSMLCLFSIRENDSLQGNLLKLAGALIGLYISLYAGSRGGWLAFPFIAIIGIYLKFTNLNFRALNKFLKISTPILAILSLILSIYLAYKYLGAFSSRIDIAIAEIRGALLNESYNTSVGTRIAMWKISLTILVPMAGMAGFGEGNIGTVVSSLNLDTVKFSEAIFHLTNTGPHSDLLAKTLSMGFIGGFSYLCTLLIPGIIFWKKKSHHHQNTRIAAQLGVCFITGVIICGFSNEMLSLKYLSSFYGLLIACLMAEIFRSPTIPQKKLI